jgi:hypothetical protein
MEPDAADLLHAQGRGQAELAHVARFGEPLPAPPSVVHDGTQDQYYSFAGMCRAASFTMAPGVAFVGACAFYFSSVSSLLPLRGSAVVEIRADAFGGTDLLSLEGLPPTLRSVGHQAFARTPLRDLRHLPYSASVHATAFRKCPALEAMAAARGFGSVQEWVADRSRVPARRRAIYGCVKRARKEREAGVRRSGRGGRGLLEAIAGLPDDMVREIVGFAHGDHHF